MLLLRWTCQAASREAAELPAPSEGEVITRRMQFRLKKNKQAQRLKKKENKAAEKLEKDKVKEEKKKLREQKKKEKEDLKAQKSLEKAKAKENKSKKRLASEIQEQDADDETEEKEYKSGSESGIGQKDRKDNLKRLRRGPKARLEKIRKMSSRLNDTRSNSKVSRTNRKRKDRKEVVVEETAASGETKVDRRNASKEKKKQNDEKETKNETKKEKKQKEQRSEEKKGKEGTTNEKKNGKAKARDLDPTPCPEIVDLVRKTLDECTISECSHPDFQPVQFDKKKFQISIYWSRLSVGVKMAKWLVDGNQKTGQSSSGNKKANKWNQIAYFGGATPCIYTNICLAHKFVPGLRKPATITSVCLFCLTRW